MSTRSKLIMKSKPALADAVTAQFLIWQLLELAEQVDLVPPTYMEHLWQLAQRLSVRVHTIDEFDETAPPTKSEMYDFLLEFKKTYLARLRFEEKVANLPLRV
jgi:hypothetical protein